MCQQADKTLCKQQFINLPFQHSFADMWVFQKLSHIVCQQRGHSKPLPDPQVLYKHWQTMMGVGDQMFLHL